jgi:uncharacterized protein YndB with AHSA1/START domain
MKQSDPPVIVEQVFDLPVETVWKAITEREQMVQWFFDNIPDFKAKVGFETQFKIHNEGRDFLHLWRITEVNPNRKITYRWSYDQYDGEALVTFELVPDGATTRLRLTNIVLADFDDTIPEFKRESCVAGWEYFIKQRLKNYLA